MIQHQLFSPIPQTKENFSRFPLPQSYVDFLLENGAGFFTNTKITTAEPTRFGLDYALCNGLSGFKEGTYFPSILDVAWSPEVTGLPEYFVVFFQDGPVYYAFDYQNGIEQEPSIRLIDVEMDQWLEVIDYQSAHRFEVIESVAFDTRKLGPNSLFVPLQGQTDGHDYIEQAIQAGATAVLWGKQDVTPPDGICAIWVDDPLQAFQKLAKWYLEKVSPRVVGITGSSGKTTTKDMTAAALGARYRVYKTQGNFNNDIGLPQTILDMPESTEALVLEMGMSDFHEIEFLSKLARPEVVAITLIGESHMEQLGSKEGIAKAKLEILSGLQENGTFIYPAHEDLITAGIAQAEKPANFNIVTVGEGSKELSARNIELYSDHTAFELVTPTETVAVTLPVLGAYNVSNALLAIEIARTLDVPLSDIVSALANFELTKNRTQWVKGQNGVAILNDAYNASPIAMKSVIKSFVSVEAAGRRVLVLGDIRELGEHSKELHASISEVISPSEVALVYLYGEEMEALYDALKGQFDSTALHHYMDKEALIADLKAELKEGDQVLIKSSNGTGLLAVVDALKAE